MSKITSKLQVTIPKALAERYGLGPGDEIEWIPAGDAIRVEPARHRNPLSTQERLRLFDGATKRLRRTKWTGDTPKDRGWTRAELYGRGRAR